MDVSKRNYSGIKKILRDHLKRNTRTLWSWKQAKDIKDEEFICLYGIFDDTLQVYTTQQLLDALDNYPPE
tara:strand:- start:111 stop:320 length:210 start_codon:yes stop_codon:yes gene_type:complete